MKQFEAVGFIINRKSLKDSDRILTVFTKEYGKISLVAKGIKKPRAKLQPHLEPLVEINFRYIGSGKLPVLVGAQAIKKNNFYGAELNMGISALFITEVLGLITIEGQPNLALYGLYRTFLVELTHSSKIGLDLVYMLLNMMKVSGIEPHILDVASKDRLYFDFEDGTITSRAISSHSFQLSPQMAKLWKACLSYHKETILRIRLDQVAIKQSVALLTDYLQHHYAKKIKSYKVLVNSTNFLQASA
jgi:DNA repair protein RecO (recombination protein O)